MNKNPVVFWELGTHTELKTIEFFKNVFEWDIEANDSFSNFFTVNTADDRGIDGAVFRLRKAKMPFLVIYIKVEDIEEKVELIKKNGGLIIEEPFEISETSKICLFNEPSGVTLAMVQKI